jgi:hypothetical protein
MQQQANNTTDAKRKPAMIPPSRFLRLRPSIAQSSFTFSPKGKASLIITGELVKKMAHPVLAYFSLVVVLVFVRARVRARLRLRLRARRTSTKEKNPEGA